MLLAVTYFDRIQGSHGPSANSHNHSQLRMYVPFFFLPASWFFFQKKVVSSFRPPVSASEERRGKWTSGYEDAFRKARDFLSEVRELAFYDPKRPWCLVEAMRLEQYLAGSTSRIAFLISYRIKKRHDRTEESWSSLFHVQISSDS